MYVCVISMKVCDSILNVGPIADTTLGSPDFISVSVYISGGDMGGGEGQRGVGPPFIVVGVSPWLLCESE